MKIFSASTDRELLALKAGGAPAMGILREVANVLGESEMFKKLTAKPAAEDSPSRQERERIRELGLDPDVVAQMDGVASLSDYKKLTAKANQKAGPK